MKEKIKLPTSWLEHLRAEFAKPYMQSLRTFLQSETKKGVKIYPSSEDYFSAFHTTYFDKVKLVLLGQDPYHGKDQAHGLSFSVKRPLPPPPSLVNIYKELFSDLKIPIASHGDLTSWAKEGVLLLNTTLTVQAGLPGSHQGKGWEEFTDQVLSQLAKKRNNIVYLLWGRSAQSKASLLCSKDNYVLKAAHPSPFSAHKGFFNCRHFSKANAYLKSKNISPINWASHL